MLQCPVCGRSNDNGFRIFVPPHTETFDTVACAERAARVLGWREEAPAPVVEVEDARGRPRVSAAPRREAALVGRRRGPGQRALLATGVSLFVAGTAAAIYLSLSGKAETRRSLSATAGVLPPRLTSSRPPDAARLPAHPRPRTRPAANPVRQPVKTFHPERPVAAGVRYEARAFPIAIRITPPDGTWGGAQWTTGSSNGRPAFGWVALGRLPINDPRGVITIETAFGPTPSVAAILARIHSAGPEAIYGNTTRVSLAGFPGWQIDGRTVGASGHLFIPFSPQSRRDTPPDSYALDRGERFRLIVLDVRGTRVVLFLESAKLPAKEFPAFLVTADRILGSLEFPG